MSDDQLLSRLAKLQVSSICDADKSITALPSYLHPITPQCAVVGPAYTLIAEDDHLSTYLAATRAPPGSVLVIATNNHSKAIVGELFSNEARRRGIRGIIVDGYLRDKRGLQKVGIPVWARGTNPVAGGMRKFGETGGMVVVGGVEVVSGRDIVCADMDGVIVVGREKLEGIVGKAERIEESERNVVRGIEMGIPIAELTNAEEYAEGLKSGKDIAFQFKV
jgi:4-hydroxy-4-methyl-2-oxoglutarate aldolase